MAHVALLHLSEVMLAGCRSREWCYILSRRSQSLVEYNQRLQRLNGASNRNRPLRPRLRRGVAGRPRLATRDLDPDIQGAQRERSGLAIDTAPLLESPSVNPGHLPTLPLGRVYPAVNTASKGFTTGMSEDTRTNKRKERRGRAFDVCRAASQSTLCLQA